MSDAKLDDDEWEYRDKNINGQVTIPAEMRGNESGWYIKEENGELRLVPAEKQESITIATAHE